MGANSAMAAHAQQLCLGRDGDLALTLSPVKRPQSLGADHVQVERETLGKAAATRTH